MDENAAQSKNIIANSQIKVEGNLALGDHYYQITNLPFLLASPKYFLERTDSYLLKDTISRFESYRFQIDSFFEEKHKQVLLIVGENESGKTHFLRDIILEASQQYHWKIASLESLILSHPLKIQLTDNEPLLLFRDDVDWKGIDFLTSALQITDNQSSIKLILTIHSSWLKNVKNVIEKIKDFPGKVLEIKLTRWEKKHLLTILRLAASSEKVDFEDDIIRQFPNPYLLKYFGEAMIGKPIIDILAIRRNFSTKTKRVFDYELQSLLNPDQTQNLILCMIFDSNLKEFALDNNIEETSLSKALHDLELVGLIKYRYGLWALFPDIKGDFYLASLIENHIESPIAELLDLYISNPKRNSIKKIIDITRYLSEESIDAISVYLTQKIDSWYKYLKENENTFFDKYVSAITPSLHIEQHYGKELTTNVACNLCMYVLSKINPLDSEHSSHSSTNNIHSVIEECARFLAELVYLPRKRDEFFAMLQVVWRSGWRTNVSNYKPSELLANAFKPFYNDINSYKIGLRYIRFWFLESNNPQLRNMGIEALQTVLGAFFEKITGKFSSIEISQVSLPGHDEIFTLRNEALNIVKEALQNDSLRLSCFEIIGQIGLGRRFGDHKDLFNLPSFPKIREEIESCIPLIGHILCSSNEVLVQKEAETILFKWWLWGISNSMEAWLSKFDRSIEYLVYRNVLERTYIIDDFNSIAQKAPEKNRWNWYWKKNDLKEKRYQGIERYLGLVQKASEKYQTPDSIALFLSEIAEKLKLWAQIHKDSEHYIWNNFIEIVQCWVIYSPKIFDQMIENNLLSVFLQEKILMAIQHQLVASNYTQVDQVVSPLLLRISSLSYAEANHLAFLIQKYPHPSKELWLEQAIKHGQEYLLGEISFRLKFIFDVESEIEKIARYLLLILQSGTITQEHFFGNRLSSFVSYEALYEHNKLLNTATDQLLREATYNYMKNISRLDESFSAVIKYTIRNVNQLIDLIEYRSQNWSVHTAMSKADFQIRKVLPHLPFIQENLIRFFQNSDNHRLFMEKVMIWQQAIWVLDSNWLKPLVNLVDSDSEKHWVAIHLKEVIDHNQYDKISFYCRHIWHDERLIPLMINAWQKILHISTDEDMISILFQWVYHRPNSEGYRNVSNRYEYYVLFWEKVSSRPILDIRLKMLIQQVKDHLKFAWEQELLHDDM